MNKTRIEWVRNQDSSQGFTSNPVRGECPIGCPYCYVKSFRTRYGWHKNIRFYPLELEAIRKRKKPAGIFIGSTIELFHNKTIQYIPKIMETIKLCPQHRFYLLTKQPQNLIKFSLFPDNCWVGVTATSQEILDHSMPHLFQIEATVRYVSFEPLLDRVDVTKYLPDPTFNCGSYYEDQNGIERWDLGGAPCNPLDWVIIGALTGKKKELLELCLKWNKEGKPWKELKLMPYGKIWTLQPKIEWVEEIMRACDKAGIPAFLKVNLVPMIADSLDPKKIILYPDGIHLRQEMPNGTQ